MKCTFSNILVEFITGNRYIMLEVIIVKEIQGFCGTTSLKYIECANTITLQILKFTFNNNTNNIYLKSNIQCT